MRIRKFGYFPHNVDMPMSPESGGTHPYHEVLFISQGRFVLEWLGETYASEGPCLFLFAQNTPHLLVGKSEQLQYLYWELEMADEESFLPLPQLVQWNSMQGNIDTSSADFQLLFRSLELLGQLMRLIQASPSTTLKQAALLDINKIFLMIQHILDETVVDAADKESDEIYNTTLIESLMRYLETHYRERVTLQSLSRLFHVSGSHLIRIFKEQQGMTPFQYLDQLRLRAAESYLLNTSHSIQEISALTGFTSIHYFSRHFKNQYGTSPSQWRSKLLLQADHSPS
ncbi:AraC family transcriptional regulator [Cohnella silvisoli]|uniref:AraC family transcriptional regulator n=1 Tax=Cohnella silvisoli TaxID=2873699 RepID=A0ABV1KQR0_9BACL|nr:AraC family transcriptional regulator [Cohnella silvisoli]MCD9024612.1 AraC family transcriptional regulator [Cohnella silvisoli]